MPTPQVSYAGVSHFCCMIGETASHQNPRRGSFLAPMILVTLALVSLTDAREVSQPEDAGKDAVVSVGSDSDEPLKPHAGQVSTSEDGTNPSADDTRRKQADTHVQSGKVLYEMGDISEAEDHLIRAVKLDPEIAHVPPAELQQLETRIFKVNPDTFLKALDAVGTFPPGNLVQGEAGDRNSGGLAIELPAAHVTGDHSGFGGLSGVNSTNLTRTAQEQLLDFFRAAGVNVMPPNQIYFKPRKGILMMRATSGELDIIQRAIEVLSEPPPRITVDPDTIPEQRPNQRADPDAAGGFEFNDR